MQPPRKKLLPNNVSGLPSDKLVAIGKIGSPWGVRGWTKVISFTEKVEDILTYPTWYVRKDKNTRPMVLETGRRHGKGVIAKFRGVDSPEKVREWAGYEVAIERAALPETESNEYYWADLEGLSVIDQNGHSLGTVGWMIQTGSTDAMVIQGLKGGQIAIPWLPDTITEVSLETREIFVDWDPI